MGLFYASRILWWGQFLVDVQTELCGLMLWVECVVWVVRADLGSLLLVKYGGFQYKVWSPGSDHRIEMELKDMSGAFKFSERETGVSSPTDLPILVPSSPGVPLRATPIQFALLVDADTQESVVELLVRIMLKPSKISQNRAISDTRLEVYIKSQINGYFSTTIKQMKPIVKRLKVQGTISANKGNFYYKWANKPKGPEVPFLELIYKGRIRSKLYKPQGLIVQLSQTSPLVITNTTDFPPSLFIYRPRLNPTPQPYTNTPSPHPHLPHDPAPLSQLSNQSNLSGHSGQSRIKK
nr:hypothetical protein [Tanacetum cinerariifolium]